MTRAADRPEASLAEALSHAADEIAACASLISDPAARAHGLGWAQTRRAQAARLREAALAAEYAAGVEAAARDELLRRMADALGAARPIIEEAIAAGVLPADDMSDRRALDRVDAALAAYRQMTEGRGTFHWRPIEAAPKNGSAFLAYGRHTHSPHDAQRGVRAGDHWWAIMLWDVWREPHQYVFALDGRPAWSPPTHWMPLPPPPDREAAP